MEQSQHIGPNSVFTFTFDASQDSMRLDRFLSAQFSAYSRSYLQGLIHDGCVTVNSVIVQKPSIILKHHDQIVVTFPPARDFAAIKQLQVNLEVIIVHEEAHFLVLDKPAGLCVHAPHANSPEPTLVDWILSNYKEIAQVGTADRPGIVHRLDKDTSGVIIIPRTPYAHATFGAMFERRDMHKTYYAVVHGHPEAVGTIDLPIARSQSNKTKMATYDPSIYTNQKVRAAITHYRVVEYFESAALLEVKPVTGRTHQIRVHCASINHPIIGDIVYGTATHMIGRQALHARALGFEFNGKKYNFMTELPRDFQDLIEKLREKKS